MDSLRLFRKASHDNRGQALVETAAALLIAIPIILWAFEMSMYCYTMAQYQYAARAGVQYAISHGTDAPDCTGPGGNVNTSCSEPTEGAAVSQVVANISQPSGHQLQIGEVVASWPTHDNNPGSEIDVVITAPYVPYVHHLPFIPPTITGTATGRITY